MNIFCISGSANNNSANQRLLFALEKIAPQHYFTYFEELMEFQVFTPTRNENPTALIKQFKESINKSDVVFISTPEYLHNIPAVLKNAFEWVTASGELNDKKVIAITYTPYAPRGEKAMESLLNSLQALKASVIAQVPLYQDELKIDDQGNLIDSESTETIKAIFELL